MPKNQAIFDWLGLIEPNIRSCFGACFYNGLNFPFVLFSHNADILWKIYSIGGKESETPILERFNFATAVWWENHIYTIHTITHTHKNLYEEQNRCSIANQYILITALTDEMKSWNRLNKFNLLFWHRHKILNHVGSPTVSRYRIGGVLFPAKLRSR